MFHENTNEVNVVNGERVSERVRLCSFEIDFSYPGNRKQGQKQFRYPGLAPLPFALLVNSRFMGHSKSSAFPKGALAYQPMERLRSANFAA